MQTITIDIINNKALKLLQDLELLKLIRVHKEKVKPDSEAAMYKGAMTRQSPEAIDKQFNELRNEWD